jgi:hypothetical protein
VQKAMNYKFRLFVSPLKLNRKLVETVHPKKTWDKSNFKSSKITNNILALSAEKINLTFIELKD